MLPVGAQLASHRGLLPVVVLVCDVLHCTTSSSTSSTVLLLLLVLASYSCTCTCMYYCALSGDNTVCTDKTVCSHKSTPNRCHMPVDFRESLQKATQIRCFSVDDLSSALHAKVRLVKGQFRCLVCTGLPQR